MIDIDYLLSPFKADDVFSMGKKDEFILTNRNQAVSRGCSKYPVLARWQPTSAHYAVLEGGTSRVVHYGFAGAQSI